MKMKSWIALCLFTLFAANVFAIENDRIRGEVLSVDAVDRTLRVKITEVGSDIDAQVGSTQSFVVPADVPIEYEIDRRVYSPNRDFDLSEMRSGDRVLLDFDTTDPNRIVKLRNEETTNVATRDRIRTNGRPSTSSDDRMAGNDRDTMPDDNQLASNDRSTRDRSALPDSASSLPLMGLLGVLFAVLALATRLARW